MVKENIRAKILDGALQIQNKYLAGIYRGYYVIVEPAANKKYVITINCSSASDPKNKNLKKFIKEERPNMTYIRNAVVYPHSVMILAAIPSSKNRIPKMINETVEPIIAFLRTRGYMSGCEFCGTNVGAIERYTVGGGHHFICEKCSKKDSVKLYERRQAVQVQRSLLSRGLIGALIGTALGAVMWILLLRLNYFAGIAGIVAGVAAFAGYEIFGKGMDKKGIIATVLVMYLILFGTHYLGYAWAAAEAFGEGKHGIFYYLPRVLETVKENGLTLRFYGELIFGYLLCVLTRLNTIRTIWYGSKFDTDTETED